jgi:uncharacterized DUF497 family protein
MGNMIFNRDENNENHIAVHNVTPEEVEAVLANDPVDLEFQVVRREDRYASVGHTSQMRILFVAWTLRGEAIRPITPYDATPTMTKDYVAHRKL